MLTLRHDSLFDSDADTLVNPVNCVGVMGKGLALEFKRRFPKAYTDYLQYYRTDGIHIGTLYPVDCGEVTVINFPTKRHWREASRLEDIARGLTALPITCFLAGTKTIAIPALGCGLGGLDWKDVFPLIEEAVAVAKVNAYVYPPQTPVVKRQTQGT